MGFGFVYFREILLLVASVYFSIQVFVDTPTSLDIIVGLLFVVYCWSQLRRHGRSFVVVLTSIVAYAILYSAHIDDEEHFIVQDKTKETELNGVYFSLVTASTVGYGDIHPVSRTYKLVVMSQILYSFITIVYFLAGNEYSLGNDSRTSGRPESLSNQSTIS